MRKGIDISKHQGNINFDLIKRSGIEFIILRGGFTGYGTGECLNKDNMFDEYYRKAKERNIPVGCYYYSCANTYEKGVKEAEFLYETCLKNRQFEYPIYIDVEEDRWQRIGKARVTEAIKGFCEYLEIKGYYVGIYANMNYFNNFIDTPKLSMYDKWVAKWGNSKPNFPYGAYGMWQNSNNGNVAGKRVDTDISYYDYPNIMKKKGLNGFSKGINDIYYSKYNGNSSSIVDALKVVNIDSSFSNREKIANRNGINNYRGTAEQNTALLNLLKNGKLRK